MTNQLTPARPDTDPPTPTPTPPAALARRPPAITAPLLLWLFTGTIRAAHQQDSLGAGGTVGLWVLVGTPAAHTVSDHAPRALLLPRSRTW